MKLVILRTSFFFSLLLFLSGCSSKEEVTPQNLTGAWRTESAVSYFVESQKAMPGGGKKVQFGGINLLERFSRLKWTLEQRSDGLVTGIHHWMLYDEQGEFLSEGEDPIIGAVNDTHIILSQASTIEANRAKVVFDCAFDGPNRLRCVGYDIGGELPFVIRFNLIREY